MTETQHDRTLKEAQTKKALAEAELAQQDADWKKIMNERDRDDIHHTRWLNRTHRRDRELKDAKDGFDRGLFRLADTVTETSVGNLRASLIAFRELHPEQPIEIEYCSPGGSVLHGFALYDLIRRLSDAGHHVTTRITGYAASMAGVLLQAGDTRIIGAQSHLHLHQVSTAAIGKVADLEDTTEFAKKLTSQICDIYVQRAGDAAQMTADELYTWIERYERWLNANEAVEQGFVDGIE